MLLCHELANLPVQVCLSLIAETRRLDDCWILACRRSRFLHQTIHWQTIDELSAHSLCTHALHRKMKVFFDTRQFVELSSRVLIPVVSRHNDSSVFTSTQLWHAYTGRWTCWGSRWDVCQIVYLHLHGNGAWTVQNALLYLAFEVNSLLSRPLSTEAVSPKHQSGANLVCSARRNDNGISSCRPVITSTAISKAWHCSCSGHCRCQYAGRWSSLSSQNSERSSRADWWHGWHPSLHTQTRR